ncbi:MAG: hypothetical protein J5504_05970 [Butyrivibrio sp.]|nr:hypothetical protein [Butyrivibrio sp.]
MSKKSIYTVLLASMILSLIGCGNTEKDNVNVEEMEDTQEGDPLAGYYGSKKYYKKSALFHVDSLLNKYYVKSDMTSEKSSEEDFSEDYDDVSKSAWKECYKKLIKGFEKEGKTGKFSLIDINHDYFPELYMTFDEDNKKEIYVYDSINDRARLKQFLDNEVSSLPIDPFSDEFCFTYDQIDYVSCFAVESLEYEHEWIEGIIPDKVFYEKNVEALDEETKNLLDAFIQGKIKAVSALDEGYELGFHEGESYTIDELVEKEWLEDDYLGCSIRFIDCGLDGKIDPVVYLDCADSDSYGYGMVLKNDGGTLKIVYRLYHTFRSWCSISYSGMVDQFYHENAGTLQHYDYGYLDADLNYHFWYTQEDEYYDEPEEMRVPIPDVNYVDDKNDLYEARLSFTEGSMENIDSKDMYYILCNDYIEQQYKANGYKVITGAEMDALIEEQRRKIGISDEVYNYDK